MSRLIVPKRAGGAEGGKSWIIWWRKSKTTFACLQNEIQFVLQNRKGQRVSCISLGVLWSVKVNGEASEKVHMGQLRLNRSYNSSTLFLVLGLLRWEENTSKPHNFFHPRSSSSSSISGSNDSFVGCKDAVMNVELSSDHDGRSTELDLTWYNPSVQYFVEKLLRDPLLNLSFFRSARDFKNTFHPVRHGIGNERSRSRQSKLRNLSKLSGNQPKGLAEIDYDKKDILPSVFS